MVGKQITLAVTAIHRMCNNYSLNVIECNFLIRMEFSCM